MALLLTDPTATSALQGMPHKTWTRDEIQVLESTGLFDGTHFELIDGELIDKRGKNRKHVKGLRNTIEVFEEIFGHKFVEHEAPVQVRIDDSRTNEPEPDVVILRRRTGELDDAPGPCDVLLLVEIADSTARHNLSVKASLYARAGYSEFWVLDVSRRKLHVMRTPEEGQYQTRIEHSEFETVSAGAAPDHVIRVADLLP